MKKKTLVGLFKPQAKIVHNLENRYQNQNMTATNPSVSVILLRALWTGMLTPRYLHLLAERFTLAYQAIIV